MQRFASSLFRGASRRAAAVAGRGPPSVQRASLVAASCAGDAAIDGCSASALAWAPPSLVMGSRAFHAFPAAKEEEKEGGGVAADKDEAAPAGKAPGNITAGDIGSMFTMSNPENYPTLKEELEFTGTADVVLRKPMWEIMNMLDSHAASGPEGRGMYLEGRRGAGKSVIVAAAAERARAMGWIVVHVKSGRAFCQTGTYRRSKDGLWDQPETAQGFLQGILARHGECFEGIKCRAGGGGTLRELVERGAGDPEVSVAIACQVREELWLVEEKPVLVVVDGYNGMFWKTDYYESLSTKSRVMIRPDMLRLVRAWRVLEGPPPKNGIVLGALSDTIGVSEKIRVPLGDWVERAEVPRLSYEDCREILKYYRAHGILPYDLTEKQVRYLHAISSGNGCDLRSMAMVQ